jgi:hypothetical protein
MSNIHHRDTEDAEKYCFVCRRDTDRQNDVHVGAVLSSRRPRVILENRYLPILQKKLFSVLSVPLW